MASVTLAGPPTVDRPKKMLTPIETALDRLSSYTTASSKTILSFGTSSKLRVIGSKPKLTQRSSHISSNGNRKGMDSNKPYVERSKGFEAALLLCS